MKFAWEANKEYWPANASLNAEVCWVVVCAVDSTGGDSASVGFVDKKGRSGVGASMFFTFGDGTPSNGLYLMGCNVGCVGYYRNIGGGWGFMFGAGTPGVFLGSQRAF